MAKRIREGAKGPSTKEERVGTYMERIEQIISSGTTINDERGWELLRDRIVKEFVLDTSNPDTVTKIAHGLFEAEKKQAIEQGQGAEVQRIEQELQQEEEILKRYRGVVKEKREVQEQTLGNWLDYLKQNDAQYPIWFRYFVVRNLQKMGTFDKERGQYSKRTGRTIAPFPELNPEALGFVYRTLVEGVNAEEHAGVENKERRIRLNELADKKDFAGLYAFAQLETAGRLNRETIDGRWVKYDQGSDHSVLENALREKGTGWCTAQGSAYAHLQGGDFYVYFTKGSDGEYTEPRVAIRMQRGNVAEVRGVNPGQELEPALVEIAQEQYQTLPGGEKFEKKSADMRRMTELMRKQEQGEAFSKEDLTFLYEIDSQIEGFGFGKDPRIEELRNKRSLRQDIAIMFECEVGQIAWGKDEISKETKVYIGPLEPGIFDLFLEHNIEHIYTSFPTPARKISLERVEIQGKRGEQLVQELEQAEVYLDSGAIQMMLSSDLTTLPDNRVVNIVRLKAGSLVESDDDDKEPDDLEYYTYFHADRTPAHLTQRARELGLELCPPEAGFQSALQYKDQPPRDLWITMKPTTGSGGIPVNLLRFLRQRDSDPPIFSGFHLEYDHGRLNLSGYHEIDWLDCYPDTELVFALPAKK